MDAISHQAMAWRDAAANADFILGRKSAARLVRRVDKACTGKPDNEWVRIGMHESVAVRVRGYFAERGWDEV